VKVTRRAPFRIWSVGVGVLGRRSWARGGGHVLRGKVQPYDRTRPCEREAVTRSTGYGLADTVGAVEVAVLTRWVTGARGAAGCGSPARGRTGRARGGALTLGGGKATRGSEAGREEERQAGAGKVSTR